MCQICSQQINKTMALKQKWGKLIVAPGLIIYMAKADGKVSHGWKCVSFNLI